MSLTIGSPQILQRRILDGLGFVGTAHKLDALTAREHGLIEQFQALLRECLQLFRAFDVEQLLHDQPSLADGDPDRRWMRNLADVVDLPANAVTQESSDFVDMATGDEVTLVEVRVSGRNLLRVRVRVPTAPQSRGIPVASPAGRPATG